MPMPDAVAALLMIVQAEIRALKMEAADLPPDDVAPVLARVERLSSKSRRLARNTAARLRSH